MKYLIMSVFLAAATLHAQTAKVVQLSPEDAAQARSLHDQRVELDEKDAEFKKQITDKYLSADVPESSAYITSGCFCIGAGCGCGPIPQPSPGLKRREKTFRQIKDGWFQGFEYSEDYKFVVPAATKPSTPCPSSIGYGNTIVPAHFSTSASY